MRGALLDVSIAKKWPPPYPRLDLETSYVRDANDMPVNAGREISRRYRRYMRWLG